MKKINESHINGGFNMKNLIKKLFYKPKYVCYINVGDMTSDGISEYINKIKNDLNIKRTLYIPGRNIETKFVKI